MAAHCDDEEVILRRLGSGSALGAFSCSTGEVLLRSVFDVPLRGILKGALSSRLVNLLSQAELACRGLGVVMLSVVSWFVSEGVPHLSSHH